MKILVTGSSGHLGEALMRTMLQTKINVIGIDILPSAFTSYTGSVTDREFINNVLNGVDAVIHTATLHKPHVATHSKQNFLDVNLSGTLNLLEGSITAGVKAFIYTSTTSTFGDALTSSRNDGASWITEDVVPIPKNIYGVTKTAAEDLCKIFHRNNGLPCIILKTSRFFPEEDDLKENREGFTDINLKANELLYRRVDVEDVVTAHLLAIKKANQLRFQSFIISATTPFSRNDLLELSQDAPAVVKRLFPNYEEYYKASGWRMLPRIDRVYVNTHARTGLGWTPKYDFNHVLTSLKKGSDFMSPLARAIGVKGYHSTKFDNGPYPV